MVFTIPVNLTPVNSLGDIWSREGREGIGGAGCRVVMDTIVPRVPACISPCGPPTQTNAAGADGTGTTNPLPPLFDEIDLSDPSSSAAAVVSGSKSILVPSVFTSISVQPPCPHATVEVHHEAPALVGEPLALRIRVNAGVDYVTGGQLFVECWPPPAAVNNPCLFVKDDDTTAEAEEAAPGGINVATSQRRNSRPLPDSPVVAGGRRLPPTPNSLQLAAIQQQLVQSLSLQCQNSEDRHPGEITDVSPPPSSQLYAVVLNDSLQPQHPLEIPSLEPGQSWDTVLWYVVHPPVSGPQNTAGDGGAITVNGGASGAGSNSGGNIDNTDDVSSTAVKSRRMVCRLEYTPAPSLGVTLKDVSSPSSNLEGVRISCNEVGVVLPSKSPMRVQFSVVQEQPVAPDSVHPFELSPTGEWKPRQSGGSSGATNANIASHNLAWGDTVLLQTTIECASGHSIMIHGVDFIPDTVVAAGAVISNGQNQQGKGNPKEISNSTVTLLGSVGAFGSENDPAGVNKPILLRPGDQYSVCFRCRIEMAGRDIVFGHLAVQWRRYVAKSPVISDGTEGAQKTNGGALFFAENICTKVRTPPVVVVQPQFSAVLELPPGATVGQPFSMRVCAENRTPQLQEVVITMVVESIENNSDRASDENNSRGAKKNTTGNGISKNNVRESYFCDGPTKKKIMMQPFSLREEAWTLVPLVSGWLPLPEVKATVVCDKMRFELLADSLLDRKEIFVTPKGSTFAPSS